MASKHQPGRLKANGEHSIDQWESLLSLLQRVPALADVPMFATSLWSKLAAVPYEDQGSLSVALRRLTKAMEQSSASAGDSLSRLSRLAHRSEEVSEEMDWKFLFDPERSIYHWLQRFGPSRWTIPTTTCLLQKRASPASSPSPRVIYRRTLVSFGTPTNLGRRRTSVDFLDRHHV